MLANAWTFLRKQLPRSLSDVSRVRRAPLHRRVFSAASVGLSYGAASVTFHGLDHLFLSGSSLAGHPVLHATVWTLLVTVAVLVRSVVNKTMIMTAVRPTADCLKPRHCGSGRGSKLSLYCCELSDF